MIIQSMPYPAASGFTLLGALARKNAAQLVGTSLTALTWQEDVYDLTAWHDTSSNTARMVVPSGTEAVRLSSGLRAEGGNNVTVRQTKSVSGGAAGVFYGMGRHHFIDGSGTDLGFGLRNICSAIVEVADADSAYFQSEYAISSGTSSPTNNGNTYFAIEAIDPTLRRVLAYKTSTQAVAAGVPEEVTWDATQYNVGSWTVSAENVTVPFTGRIRISCNLNSSTASNTLSAQFFVNGASVPGSALNTVGDVGADYLNAVSAVIEVTPGDEISVQVSSSSATNINNNEHSWLCVEEVPEDYICVLLHRNSGTQTIGNADTAVEWQVAAYEDETGLWDAGSPTLVIAPFSGYFRQTFGLIGSSVANQFAAWGEQEASIYYGSPGGTFSLSGADRINSMGAWAPCSAGDEIRLMARSVSSRTIGTDNETFMCVEFRS